MPYTAGELLLKIPNWMRWILLVPASLAGGFLAGYFMYLVNASQAFRPDAPIVYIAEFLGGFLSNLTAFHIAHSIAPSRERTVLIIYICVAILAGIVTVYVVVKHEGYRGLLIPAGNLVACYIAWRQLLSPHQAR